jgi:hypothetical protein
MSAETSGKLVDITQRNKTEAGIQFDADALTKLNELSSRLWSMRNTVAVLISLTNDKRTCRCGLKKLSESLMERTLVR